MTPAMTKTGSRWPTAKDDLWQDISAYGNYTITATNNTWVSDHIKTYSVPTGTNSITITQNPFIDAATTMERWRDEQWLRDPYRTQAQNVADALGTVSRAVNAALGTIGNAMVDFQNAWKQRQAALPPPPGFNTYLNASDLLEQFIGDAGAHGLTADEVRNLPVDLFIKWLVVRACEADQIDAGVDLDLRRDSLPPRPRCVGCGRFMRPSPVALCRPRCADLHFARRALVAA